MKVDSLDDLFEEEPSDSKPSKENNDSLKLEEDFAPVLPQSEVSNDEQDLQKELEAKFDELFGPIDEED